MMIVYILVAGIAIGLLPSVLKLDKIVSVPNVILGFLGALIGALLGFGDAPLLLQYSFLNEITFMFAGALILVFGKVFLVKQFGIKEKSVMVGIAAIIGLLAGTFIGASLGGNYFVNFVFLGNRGHEAAALLGGTLGALVAVGVVAGISKLKHVKE